MFRREVDLYPNVIRHFNRYSVVSAEVPFGMASIDLVFASQTFRSLVAVEVKRGRPWKAVKQAVHAQQFADFSFIALPADCAAQAVKTYGFVIEQTGIGVIGVLRHRIVVLVKPRRSRRICRSARTETKLLLKQQCNLVAMPMRDAQNLIHGERHAAKLLQIRHCA